MVTRKQAVEKAIAYSDEFLVSEVREERDAFIVTTIGDEIMIGGGIVAVMKATGEVLPFPSYALRTPIKHRQHKKPGKRRSKR